MRKLKLIWDFRGPNALKTAEHHTAHLKDYVVIQKLDITTISFQALNDIHAIAFMIVDEQDMKPIRDALKPHRGQVYQD